MNGQRSRQQKRIETKAEQCERNLKAVCQAFDWVIMTIQRIGNLNG